MRLHLKKNNIIFICHKAKNHETGVKIELSQSNNVSWMYLNTLLINCRHLVFLTGRISIFIDIQASNEVRLGAWALILPEAKRQSNPLRIYLLIKSSEEKTFLNIAPQENS